MCDVHQSFPIAWTNSSGPLKNTLTILLQPVELDWRSDDDDDDDELAGVFVTSDEYFELDGIGIDEEDDFESFMLLVLLVLMEDWLKLKIQINY